MKTSSYYISVQYWVSHSRGRRWNLDIKKELDIKLSIVENIQKRRLSLLWSRSSNERGKIPEHAVVWSNWGSQIERKAEEKNGLITFKKIVQIWVSQQLRQIELLVTEIDGELL